MNSALCEVAACFGLAAVPLTYVCAKISTHNAKHPTTDGAVLSVRRSGFVVCAAFAGLTAMNAVGLTAEAIHQPATTQYKLVNGVGVQLVHPAKKPLFVRTYRPNKKSPIRS